MLKLTIERHVVTVEGSAADLRDVSFALRKVAEAQQSRPLEVRVQGEKDMLTLKFQQGEHIHAL